MKNKISILIISFLSIIFVVCPLFGQAASVGFFEVMDITETGVILEAIANCGSSPGCTEWGFEWGTSPGDYTESSWSSGSPKDGSFLFYKPITSLNPETTYYVRAGAEDEDGWGFTSEASFTTDSSFILPSCIDHNVWGWAWSSNIGWISFSCRNRNNLGEGIDYGVDICKSETDPRCDTVASPKTGKFIGGAWSRGTDNDGGGVGWISFNRSETGAPPFDDVCHDGSCLAKIDFSTGEVSGWARAAIFGSGDKLYESYIIDYDIQQPWKDFLYDSTWQGQTFTVGATGPNEIHKAKRISLFLYNASSSTKTVIVSIRPSTLDNTDLCIGTQTIAPGSGREWYDIFLEDGVEDGCILSSNTEYLIAARCPDCSFSNISWGNYIPNLGSIAYPGGRDYQSDDGGNIWKIDSGPENEDFRFKIWGTSVLRLGGWDGWIRLRGTVQSDGSPYGAYLDSNSYPSLGYSEFRGWGWGGDDAVEEATIGWISFNCLDAGICGVSDYKVMTDIAITLNNIPSATNLSQGQTSGCGSAPIVRFSWDYNDGDDVPPGTDPQSAYEIQIDDDPNLDEDPITTLSGGASTFRDYSPPSFGTTYWWRVRVQDTDGPAWSDWADGPNFIPTEWPKPDFTWCPSDPGTDETIQFCSVFEIGVCDRLAVPSCSNMASSADDLTTCAAGCNLWEWDFDNDGTPEITSNDNPTYSYFSPGDYTVRLTVTDINGHSCSKQDNISANIPLPTWREIAPF